MSTEHPRNTDYRQYFAYSPIEEWGGKKLRVPIEDSAIVVEDGVQFLHAANYRLLVIR